MAQVWTKRVLVPLWALQLIFLALLFIVGVIALAVTKDIDWDDTDLDLEYGNYKRIVDAGAGVLIALSGTSILFDLIEIVQLARQKLSPVLFLVFACIKTVFWVFYMVLSLLGGVNRSFLATIVAIILALTSIAQLIYGSVVVHRHRKSSQYRSANSEEMGMDARGSRESDRARGAQVQSLEVRSNPFRDHSPAPSGTQQSIPDTNTAYVPYRAY